MRRFVYSVVTLDEYTRHPVNGSAGASRTHFSELLAGPLTDLTAAVAKLLRAIAATVEHGQGSGREATSRLNCGWPVFREAPPGRPSRRGNTEEAPTWAEEQASAAAGVERASVALAQQLAQFCRAAMAGSAHRGDSVAGDLHRLCSPGHGCGGPAPPAPPQHRESGAQDWRRQCSARGGERARGRRVRGASAVRRRRRRQ